MVVVAAAAAAEGGESTADLSVRSEIGMTVAITPEDVEVAAAEEVVEGAEVSGATTGRIAEAIATETIKITAHSRRMSLDESNVWANSIEVPRADTEGPLLGQVTVVLLVVGTTVLLHRHRHRQRSVPIV